jgi:hypothetical protein
MGDDAKTLVDRLSKWLEHGGYPLEMVVARKFRSRRFHVQQSEFFQDPLTGQSREIDVVAMRQRDIDGWLIRFELVVECKKTTDRPWVVFTDPSIGLASPARVVQRAASSAGKKYLYALRDNSNLQDLSLFEIPARPGYSIAAAFSSGEDRAFQAVSSVAAATRSLATSMNRTRVAEVLFPVVVIDGYLFECFLDETQKPVVRETQNAVLLWRNQVVLEPHTIIHVTTLSGFEALLDGAVAAADAFLHQDEIVRAALKRPRA